MTSVDETFPEIQMTTPSPIPTTTPNPDVEHECTTPHKKSMSWIHLSIIVYFSIGGGPFGFEESIIVSNPAWSLWSLFVFALLWALPQSLTMAELSVRYEGGYNEWVLRALGYHLGLFHSIVRTLFNVLCNAGYLSLFYDYINTIYHSTLFFDYSDNTLTYYLLKIPTLLIFIVFLISINVLGARHLSSFGILLTICVISPFIILFCIATPTLDVSQLLNFTVVSTEASFPQMVSVVMFNLMGWDFVGNVSSQSKRPKRDVPLAMIVALTLVLLTYTVPTLDLITSLDFSIPPSDPTSPYVAIEPLYVLMANAIWAPMSYAIEIATIIGVFGLASTFLQTSSQALSHATNFNFLPAPFAKTFYGTSTPYFSILFQAVFACFVSIFVTFNQIVSVQMWFLSISTVIIMVSYLVIRWRAYLKKEGVEALFYLPFHPVLLTLFVLPTILLSLFQLFYKVGEWHVIIIGFVTLVICESITIAILFYRKKKEQKMLIPLNEDF